MSKLVELKTKYGVTVALVGSSLVIGSVFGQCVLSPPQVETVEEPAAAEVAPAVEPTPAPEAVVE
tara:strand:+ start:1448 stop:1642 length:195 start_codon:yes stop_codon:yes gene_type:complete